MTGQRVVIHIEELVLRGFPPLDRHAVAEALERVLAGSEAVRAPSRESTPQLDAGSVTVGDGPTGPAIGDAVAKAVGAAIGGGTPKR